MERDKRMKSEPRETDHPEDEVVAAVQACRALTGDFDEEPSRTEEKPDRRD